MNPEDMTPEQELEQLQAPLTEAEIAELVQATGMLGRRLAFQRDKLERENKDCRKAIKTITRVVKATTMRIYE